MADNCTNKEEEAGAQSAGLAGAQSAGLAGAQAAGMGGAQGVEEVGEDGVSDESVMITSCIDGRDFTFDNTKNSKSILISYCHEFELPKPEFDIHEEFKPDRYYNAIVAAGGKQSIGSGTSKPKAEAAACNKFLSNYFLSGRNSLHLGNKVCAVKGKYPPSKQIKSQRKIEKFNQKKREAAAKNKEDAVGGAGQETVGGPGQETVGGAGQETVGGAGQEIVAQDTLGEVGQDPIVLAKENLYVAFDLERSAGPDNFEIIQIAYASKKSSGSSYIIPTGSIDRYTTMMCHQITCQGKRMKKNGTQVVGESLLNAGLKFIDFLKQEEKKPILICHGLDMVTLLNNLASVNLSEEVVACIGGSINTNKVFKNDENISCIGLTNMTVKTNLAEAILGNEISREEMKESAHDALFDSVLLYKVWDKYMENLPTLDAALLLRDYVESSSLAVSQAKATISDIRSRRNRRGRSKHEEKGIVYFY